MAGRKSGGLPADLSRARQRFVNWRRRRVKGERIPEPLWSLAVELATRHGVCRTASTLKLGYNSLKQRRERAGMRRASFVELTPGLPPPASECIVEFGDGKGAGMRVHLKGCEAPDLVTLAHSFWNAE